MYDSDFINSFDLVKMTIPSYNPRTRHVPFSVTVSVRGLLDSVENDNSFLFQSIRRQLGHGTFLQHTRADVWSTQLQIVEIACVHNCTFCYLIFLIFVCRANNVPNRQWLMETSYFVIICSFNNIPKVDNVGQSSWKLFQKVHVSFFWI